MKSTQYSGTYAQFFLGCGLGCFFELFSSSFKPPPTHKGSAVFLNIGLTHTSGLQIYGGPGSLSHDFRIWPITFQGSGPSRPIRFSCEKTVFNKKNIHLTASLQTPQNSCQYSYTCQMQPLKKDKTKIFTTNGSLMQVKRIAECSSWSILQYF